jgi:hypothetical protein
VRYDGAAETGSAALVLSEGARATVNFRHKQIERFAAASPLEKPAAKDDCTDMLVTICRTETMTGQTMVIDYGPLFSLIAADSRHLRHRDQPIGFNLNRLLPHIVFGACKHYMASIVDTVIGDGPRLENNRNFRRRVCKNRRSRRVAFF